MREVMDVMVVGFPRTGSTMMAGLLHWPEGGQVCLSERRVHQEGQYRKFRKEIEWARVWGVKEVNPGRIEASLRVWPLEKVRKVVMMVRDPVEAMASHWEAREMRGQRWLSPERQLRRLVERDLPVLERLKREAGKKLRVVQYEKFVGCSDCQGKLEEWLEGWKLEGDPSGLVRGYEKRRGVVLRDVSEREADGRLREFKRVVARETHVWRQRLGYR